jgi:hypothetical protein
MSEPSDVEARIREAWRAFGELNEELLEVALAVGLDEGRAASLPRRLLGHLAYSTLVLHGDPAHPELFNVQYSPWNWGHSNPDTLYLAATVDDRHDYRVHGRLGTVAQTTFGMYAGKSDQAQAVKIQAEDLEIGPDGEVELFFRRERRDGPNEFGRPEGANSFASYQTYDDWEAQTKGTLRIECLNPGEVAGPTSVEDSLAAFAQHLEDSRTLWGLWIRDIPALMFDGLPVNAALPPMQPPAAMAGAWFTPVPWELDEDQGLVLELRIPDGSPYSGICLTDRWSSMIDIETRQTSLNRGQSLITDGNRVRVLLSRRDVGVHNWLDGRGHANGMVTWRTTYDTAPEPMHVEVIDLADVDRHFPAEARVTPEQRAVQIAARQAHFAERNTP